MTKIHYHEMNSLEEEWLGLFLDLFQSAFPPEEQVRLSTVVTTLRQKASGEAREHTLLCALNKERDGLLGMAWFEQMPDEQCLFLWYLAVQTEQRGQGIGTQIFQEILRRAEHQELANLAVVLEVEIPEHAISEEVRTFAQRRIEFYRRNGSKLCGNIVYFQDVGWQPATQMHLIIHPLCPAAATVEGAREIVKSVFGDSVRGLEAMTLE